MACNQESTILSSLHSLLRLRCFVFQTAETLQIKGLAEKFSEFPGNLMTNSSPRKAPLISSSSLGSSRLLSVPSQHSVGSRQMSTESLPEYFNRYVWMYSKVLIQFCLCFVRGRNGLGNPAKWGKVKDIFPKKEMHLKLNDWIVFPGLILQDSIQLNQDSIPLNQHLESPQLRGQPLPHLWVQQDCNFERNSGVCLVEGAVVVRKYYYLLTKYYQDNHFTRNTGCFIQYWFSIFTWAQLLVYK